MANKQFLQDTKLHLKCENRFNIVDQSLIKLNFKRKVKTQRF